MAQLTANAQGVIKGKFTIPPNVPAGSKSVTFTGSVVPVGRPCSSARAT